MSSKKHRVAIALAVGSLFALSLTALATGASQSSQATVGAGTASATKSVCGLGNGKKAKGAAIKLGGIFTQIPGVDFTTIGKIAQAYFKCVNDNGGINGRPISYTIYTEQLDAAQNKNLAKKLIESDKVVGVVGNTSLIECAINAKYYKAKGYIRDRRRRARRVLRVGGLRTRQHGPALQRTSVPPRRSSARVRSRSSSRRRQRWPSTRTAGPSSSRRRPGSRTRASARTCR